MKTRLCNCSVIDVVNGRILRNHAVLINKERIVAVGPDSEVSSDKVDQEFDCNSMYLLPGFIDMHTHISYDGSLASHSIESSAFDDAGYRTLKSYLSAMMHLNAGFTTIRDCGSLFYEDISLRRAINEKLIEGPTVIASGKPLSITGGHGDFNVNRNSRIPTMGLITDGVEQMRLNTRFLIKQGVDWIKIFGSGGVTSDGDSPDQAQYTLNEIKASVTEAHFAKKRVAVHAHSIIAIENSLRAGADTIEHGTWLCDKPDLIGEMKNQNIALMPNLCTPNFIISRGTESMSEYAIAKAMSVRDMRKKSAIMALRSGVKVILGTDSGFAVRHDESAYEFRYLVEAGFTNLEALQAGTVNASEVLGLNDRIGTIEAGKFADMVLVDRNPLEDIRILTDRNRIVNVFRHGKLIKSSSKAQ